MRSRDILPGLPRQSAEKLRDIIDQIDDPDNIGACWPFTVVRDPGGKLQFGLDMTYEDFRPWLGMPTLDAQTNDLDIFQFNWLLLQLDSQSILTGMQRGARGVKVWFTNISESNCIIADLSTASDTHNQFTCPGGIDFVLTPGAQCYAVHDGNLWWIGDWERSDASYYVTNDPNFPNVATTGDPLNDRKVITINGVPIIVKKIGTMVFNVATRKLEVWDGNHWVEFCPCNEEQSGSGSGLADLEDEPGVLTLCCPFNEVPQVLTISFFNGTGVYSCLEGKQIQLFFVMDPTYGPIWRPVSTNIPGCDAALLGFDFFGCVILPPLGPPATWGLYLAGTYSTTTAALAANCSPYDVVGHSHYTGSIPNGEIDWQVTKS